MDLTADKLAIGACVCLVWVLSISCHEFSHAIVAYWGGDTSVKQRGYLSFNPFAYTNLGMTVVLPAVFLILGGFALPGAAVYVQDSRLRNRLWQSAVSAAGPLATFAVTFVLAFAFKALQNNGRDPLIAEILAALGMLVYFHCGSLVLNVLPFPGIDGYGVIEPWLPRSLQESLRKYGNAGFGLILLMLWMPGPNGVLWAVAGLISSALGVPPEVGEIGFDTFRIPVAAWSILTIVALYVFRRKELTGSGGAAGAGNTAIAAGGATGTSEATAAIHSPKFSESRLSEEQKP